MSAILVSELPKISQYFRTPPMKIATESNWQKKINYIVNQVEHKNITSICGTPSYLLHTLYLIKELYNVNDLKEVFPKLELIVHGGTSINPYQNAFKELLNKDTINYCEVYNASEGFFAFEYPIGSKEMILLLNHGVFYEFIPVNSSGKIIGSPISLNNVEKNKPYSLLISTIAGLWRYSLGDIIEFTSINPFRIKILGRTKQFLNLAMEKITVSDAEKAIQLTTNEIKCTILNFTLGPAPSASQGKVKHQWLIEFKNHPSDSTLFSQSLDQNLQKVNWEYQSLRKNNRIIEPPLISILENGTFDSWLKKQNKLNGQAKIPRVYHSRKIIDSILQ